MSDVIDPIQSLNTDQLESDNEGITTSNQSETGKWVDQLSKEYRSDESLKGKAKLDDLFKDYKDRGTKLADLESKVKAFEVPKDVSEYELDKTVLDQLKLPKEVQDFYKKSFLDAGLSKDQASKTFSELTKQSLAILKSNQDQRAKLDAERDAAIQKDWGQDFAINKSTVDQAVKHLFGDAGYAKLKQAGLDKDLDILKGLLPIGRAVSEGKFVKGGMSNEEKDPLSKFYSSMQKKSQ